MLRRPSVVERAHRVSRQPLPYPIDGKNTPIAPVPALSLIKTPRLAEKFVPKWKVGCPPVLSLGMRPVIIPDVGGEMWCVCVCEVVKKRVSARESRA